MLLPWIVVCSHGSTRTPMVAVVRASGGPSAAYFIFAPCGWEQRAKWEGLAAGLRYPAGAGQQRKCRSVEWRQVLSKLTQLPWE